MAEKQRCLAQESLRRLPVLLLFVPDCFPMPEHQKCAVQDSAYHRVADRLLLYLLPLAHKLPHIQNQRRMAQFARCISNLQLLPAAVRAAQQEQLHLLPAAFSIRPLRKPPDDIFRNLLIDINSYIACVSRDNQAVACVPAKQI